MRRLWVSVLCLLLALGLAIGWRIWSPKPAPSVVFQNKPLEAWFFGSRTNFFLETTRHDCQRAIDAVGTNAFPFLLAKLKEKRSNRAIYHWLYPRLPGIVQRHLPFPISGDDIKAITFVHLQQMRGLRRDHVQAIAELIPGLANARLRMMGLQILVANFQSDPAFLPLCRSLLDDTEPGIRLEAAISLAESAIAHDPAEPRLFPILLSGLEEKAARKVLLDLNGYSYRQQPPGGSGPFSLLPKALRLREPDPDAVLVERINSALLRLKPYLSEEQRNLLKRALP